MSIDAAEPTVIQGTLSDTSAAHLASRCTRKTTTIIIIRSKPMHSILSGLELAHASFIVHRSYETKVTKRGCAKPKPASER